jgi:O-acetyl-ADP-ribose deacetylase (regulator of RNase III)
MIEFRTGDILKADVEALVNTVNCVGVMGKGIALQFKQAFPDNFKAYAAACKRDEVRPGRVFVFETRSVAGPKFIINFPTKRHWRGNSKLEDIESGLVSLLDEIRTRGIRSIAIPPLGAGLGGLNWADVRLRIEGALQTVPDVDAVVFEPSAPPPFRQTRPDTPPAMTAGRAALVELMDRYLGGLLDPFVTLLEVHKLMYFMQEAGEPLKLRYQAGHYGPYAENLKHVLRTVEGYMVSGFVDDGDAPTRQLALVPGAVDDARRFLSAHVDSQRRFEKVSDLVAGFESPVGLELLATVHWVMTRGGATTLEAVVQGTHGWSDRKKQFTPRQIGVARDTLLAKGWA